MESELRDSSEILGDWAALRERIAEDGYVFVPGLLDPDLVGAVGRRGLGALQAAGWTEPGEDPVSAPPAPPVRAVRMRDAFGQPGYRDIVRDPGFNQLPFTARFESLMNELLGPDGFCYPLKVPRVVYPTTFAPHQPGNYAHKDYNAVQDMFTCWVPLGEIPRSLGGLAIEPGSQHSARIRPHPVEALPAGWVTTDYQPGDLLVFHCLTTHAALPNHDHRMRFSAEYRWQLADRPAPRRLVTGPAGQELYSRLFARTAWWHPVPSKLELFDDQFGQRQLPAPPSRFVTMADAGV
jgi:hypothetical protein